MWQTSLPRPQDSLPPNIMNKTTDNNMKKILIMDKGKLVKFKNQNILKDLLINKIISTDNHNRNQMKKLYMKNQ